MFLRNVGCFLLNYAALYARRQDCLTFHFKSIYLGSTHFSSASRMLHISPIFLSFFDFNVLIIFDERYALLNFSSLIFLQPPVVSTLLDPDILFTALFSELSTFGVYVFPSVRETAKFRIHTERRVKYLGAIL
jgi:hypothetical protein